MAGRSSDVLASATCVSGILRAGLADAKGRLIVQAPDGERDLDAAAKGIPIMLAMCRAAGRDLGCGAVRMITVEGLTAHVAIAPAEDASALLLVADARCRLGRLRMEAERARAGMMTPPLPTPDTAVSAAGDTPARVQREAAVPQEPATAPAGKAAPTRPSEADGTTGTVGANVPVSRPAGTSGEVVVLGTHTFRLVRKLAEQLLKIDGVRSSRLRAYSPCSTVIDVGLDDGATLAGIDTRPLNDVAVERTEDGGTRLVLRVERTTAGPGSPG
jgi:predicted regulator of Ras-like GTPase activity (Roadblock/LC7/MglB family)